MKPRIIKLISEITFWAGIALSVVSVYILVSSGISLPAGACPVNNGRPFMTAAVVFLAISFIASFFTRKGKKNEGNEN